MDEVGNFYRYVVKCDRIFNARVERAAKAAGQTATTFVQKHFDRILGDDEAAPKDKADRDSAPRKPVRVAASSRASILAALKTAGDEDGTIAMSFRELSTLCNVSYETVRAGLNELVHDGIITSVRASGRGNIGIYRFVDGAK